MGGRASKSSPDEPVPVDWCAIPDTTLALAAGLPHVVVPQLVVPDVAVFLPPSSIALRSFNDGKCCITCVRPKYHRAEATQVLPFLARLPHLTDLKLANLDVNNATLAFVVKKLPRLQVLRLVNAPWSITRFSDAVERFGVIPQVRSLHLSGRFRVTELMPSIVAQPALRELYFNNCIDVTENALAHLPRIPRLEVLSLRECDGVGEHALSHVAQLLHLRELDLQGCRMSTLSELRHHPALEKLSLDACATNDSLDLVPTLPRLRDLTIANVWLTEKGLAHIGQGARLQRLSFEGCSIDSGSKCIGFLTELEFLRLHNFERFDLRHLKRLSQLRHLHLGRSPNVTTTALEHLSGLPNLETLSLSECAMPAESIQCIERLPHLTSLDVSRCRCVDESALLALAPRLRDLAPSDPHPHNVVYR